MYFDPDICIYKEGLNTIDDDDVLQSNYDDFKIIKIFGFI